MDVITTTLKTPGAIAEFAIANDVRTIIVEGTHLAGKTTLIEHLAEYYEDKLDQRVVSYAPDAVKHSSAPLTYEGLHLTVLDVLQQTVVREEHATAGPVVLLDRGFWSTLVYNGPQPLAQWQIIKALWINMQTLNVFVDVPPQVIRQRYNDGMIKHPWTSLQDIEEIKERFIQVAQEYEIHHALYQPEVFVS